MAGQNFKSAGVSVQEIDLTFTTQLNTVPGGIPACVIGTSVQGPAYVPIIVGNQNDFNIKFGQSNGENQAQLAGQEWLRNSNSLVFLRTLGIGSGEKRNTDGTVTSAGFIVGEKQPSTASTGFLLDNNLSTTDPQSDDDVTSGRTYFLGCFMSASSTDSNFFSESGISLGETAGNTAPVIRAVLMTARGVSAKLKTSFVSGSSVDDIGDVILVENGASKADFVLVLENHVESSNYPSVITASFDPLASNYLANVLNTNATSLQEAGHYLYTHWDVENVNAVITSSMITNVSGTLSGSNDIRELAAFILHGANKNSFATASIPNFENFSNRFTHAKTPFIISQDFGGKRYNLFKLHSLNDGAGHAQKVKFTIENIVRSTNPLQPYGTFDLLIRDINDTDTSKIILEQFRNLTLDPGADNYISKVIGDTNIFFDLDRNPTSQALNYEGSFQNRSIYVRVEVSEELETGEVPIEALPFGFRGIYHLTTSGSAPLETPSFDTGSLLLSSSQFTTLLKSATVPPVQMRKTISIGTGLNKNVQTELCWGAQFETVSSLTEPNKSSQRSKNVINFMKYFPDFGPDGNVTVWSGDNEGVADTSENGVLDADRFHNNLFTLENIHVLTNSSGIADNKKWHLATYNKNPNHVESGKRKLIPTDMVQLNRQFLKFNFFMQGGFDGVNIFNEYESKLNTIALEQDMLSSERGQLTGPNVVAYTKAVDIISNTSEVDFKLLVVPGVRNNVVTNKIIDVVEERFDAIYLMDIEEFDDAGNKIIVNGSTNVSVSNTVTEFESLSLNSSFAAAYFPDVNLFDRTSGKTIRVAPSVAVLGAFSLNDKLGHPWFAPAGFTRGALQTTLETAVKLSQDNIDSLYDVDINPLIAFPGNSVVNLTPSGGVVVWGQKTLLKSPSTLDRVNVRRLLIEIRRSVKEIANTFIFEPAREETLQKFAASVEPRLLRVKNLGGLSNYQVNIDTSTTTQADIEANTIRGKIYVQPIKSLEFVSIDFVVSNQLAGI